MEGFFNVKFCVAKFFDPARAGECDNFGPFRLEELLKRFPDAKVASIDFTTIHNKL